MDFIGGAAFSALAALCTFGAIRFGEDFDGVFYFLAEAAGFVVAALFCFGIV